VLECCVVITADTEGVAPLGHGFDSQNCNKNNSPHPKTKEEEAAAEENNVCPPVFLALWLLPLG
jgi:hypothetical protein